MKKRSKIIIAAVAAFSLLSGSALAVTAGPRLYIDKEEFASSYLKLKMEDGTAMVSLRAMMELIKGEVTYKDGSLYVSMPEATELARQVHSLQQALTANTPEEAAEFWIRGIQTRSGSLQYAVLSPAMQERTKQEFSDNYWVTGGSSPHMGTVTQMNKQVLSPDRVEISFDYPLIVSGAVYDTGRASLVIEKESGGAHDIWAISEMSLLDPGDTGLMVGAKKMDTKK